MDTGQSYCRLPGLSLQPSAYPLPAPPPPLKVSTERTRTTLAAPSATRLEIHSRPLCIVGQGTKLS